MTAKISPITATPSFDIEMKNILQQQKAAYLQNPMPTAEERIAKLERLRKAVINYQNQLIAAVNQDFGNRSEAETMLTEIFTVLDAIAFNRKRIKKWMKPERRHVPLLLTPASAKVIRQPLGIIGIVVPWNFPINLCLSPLVSALAAGNRVMIKMSEFAPQTAIVIKQLLASVFDEDEVAVITGELEVSQAFTSLPFDHLLFTGATSVGKVVMRAAAENLTPVSLELGGKSPVIIHDSYDIKLAAERIAFGKSINTGQLCVSPDYVLCPENKVDALVKAIIEQLSNNFPSLLNNKDFTSIINERQRQRLQSYLDDAQSKGATLHTINPAQEDFTNSGKLAPTIVTNTNADMLVEQEEIFGPILPIKTYRTLNEAIDYVNSRPRPLALYYFDNNRQRTEQVINQTHSGGVSVNETLNHVMNDDLPFGGVGPSGMGHYHGKEGFINFSKTKGVLIKGKFNSARLLSQPWEGRTFNLLQKFMMFRFKHNLF